MTRRRGFILTLIGLLVVIALGAWFQSTRSDGVAGDQADPAPRKPGVFRLAFGSCNKQWLPNHVWKAVLNCKPDVWVWLGDSIYAPTEDMAYLKSQYEEQERKGEYMEFVRSCRVIGTWGDNDYGMKNGNRHYPRKAESQQLFLDFVDEPQDSVRRRQTGLYASYVFGDPGKQVKVILLDEYYHADEPGPESDLLGEEHWQWLDRELKGDERNVVVLGSAMQLLAAEHPYGHWDDYPKSRQRLLQLLAETRPRLTVILSGDRHLGEISKADDSGLPYPLYEATSSGLTHHVDLLYHLTGFFFPETNRYRVGELFYEKNFGLLDIDWTPDSPTFSVQIRDQEDRIQRQASLAPP